MDIHLKHIVPAAFEYQKIPTTLWGLEQTLSKNQTYQVIAASGTGKSTLVAILAGTRGDYTGQLILMNSTADTFNTKAWSTWRSVYASFVFQDLRLFPHLTAVGNIRLQEEITKNKSSNEKELQARLESLGIADKKDVHAKYLSFGQQQRVAILRALHRNYQWLILDEPFSHLDQNNAITAWKLIQEDAQAKQAGIIITSLDPYPFIKPNHTFIL